MKPKKPNTSLKLDTALKYRAQAHALQNGMSLTELISNLLREYLYTNKP